MVWYCILSVEGTFWWHLSVNLNHNDIWSPCCHPLGSKRMKPAPNTAIFSSSSHWHVTPVHPSQCWMCLWVCRLSRQTGSTGVQSHDPALTWMKEMVTLLETKPGKGESEGLAGQPPTMGPCSKTAGHTKARETPSFPLPHCNRAGISHWAANSYSIKLLFNLTPGLHRNPNQSGGMFLR